MQLKLKFKSDEDWRIWAGMAGFFGFITIYSLRLMNSSWEGLGVGVMGIITLVLGYTARRFYKRRWCPQFTEQTVNVVSYEIIKEGKKK